MTDRGYKTDLFFSAKEGLKINNNNSVCENMDWQRDENTKKTSGLHEKYISMQASFHTALEIKIKMWDVGS